MNKACSALLGVCLAALPLGAHAQDFYANNDINIVVGFSPGGSNDAYARLLGRHIGRHIPGNPNVIVQNMPGAGSLTSVRHLDTIAATDGTVVVIFNPGLILSALVDPVNIPVDFRDYNWLGSISRALRVCSVWHTSDIDTWDDLVASDEVISGSTAPGTSAYIDAAVLKNVFGVKIRPIVGFPGNAEVNLALERGEIDINCNTWSAVSETWRQGDELVPIVRLADIEDPDLSDDVPILQELAETDEQREILDVIYAGHIVSTPFILSNQVPEERLEILRAAFDATVEDPAFLEEAERLGLLVLSPLSGSEAEVVIDDIYARLGADPELVERVRNAMEM